ncbi:MAG: nucleotidyl transferase AbiEii/AbiGii toxin family protein [Syntrophobacterales bacterium]|nr:nucleotidyl transferase AbiEii/AbiGii toxin family protein [Syntrophobacterales bacterium]
MFFRCITADMATILKNPVIRELPPQTYLAGGTAVALHLGHRLSVDFDFFTLQDMDSLQWFHELQKAFSGIFRLSAVKIEKNTLVANMNSTGFSIFTYPYPLIEEPGADTALPVLLASLRDLALMKLIAINQRGACKDFIDLKCIMEKTGLTMDALMRDIRRKYSVGEEMLFQLKKSLLYFDDAERDLNVNMFSAKSGRFEPLADDAWIAVKRYFEHMLKKG